MESNDIREKITALELEMQQGNFWEDKNRAQLKIKELQDLKDALEGASKYDRGSAIMTIFSGAGGDDAEDFSAMLLRMYTKYVDNKGWLYKILHENQNDLGGYRNVTLEIDGKNVYKNLKNESGVHRLVRISPFNAKAKRNTSFSMVEVIPKLEKLTDISVPPDDIKVEFTRSSGPGGQNVNKRETAVRVVHIPSGISAESQAERSQEQNKEKALQLLYGKIFKRMEDERKKTEAGMYVSKTTDIEWGNQIRSYVLHPYKKVKDHRTGVEVGDVDSVLEDGAIDEFIEAEATL